MHIINLLEIFYVQKGFLTCYLFICNLVGKGIKSSIQVFARKLCWVSHYIIMVIMISLGRTCSSAPVIGIAFYDTVKEII